MNEADPFPHFEFMGGFLEHESLALHDLANVASGDVIQAKTETANWILEANGYNEDGCLLALVTYMSERPLSWWGRALPDLYLRRKAAAVGGFLSNSGDLVIQTQIPERYGCTTIVTAPIILLTRFSPAN